MNRLQPPAPRRLLALLALVLSLGFTTEVRAERDLATPQSTRWVGTQYAILAGLTLANVGAATLGRPVHSAALDTAFWGDSEAERNYSPLSAHVSDITLLTTVATPVATLAARGSTAWCNTLLVYGQSLEASLLVNTLTKRWVRRARPFTHGKLGRARAGGAGSDAFYSFYSGHSTMSFTAATSSSLLFAQLEENSALSIAHFSSSFALAAFTAHARVRAGKHYPSDVVVGSLVGVLMGALVPAAHRLPVSASPAELAGALGGFGVGLLGAFLLPNKESSAPSLALPRVDILPGGAVLRLPLQNYLSTL